jgi:streptomycin 6-kinase
MFSFFSKMSWWHCLHCLGSGILILMKTTVQVDLSRKGGTFMKEKSGTDPSEVIGSDEHSHTLLQLTEKCEVLTHLEDNQSLRLVNI